MKTRTIRLGLAALLLVSTAALAETTSTTVTERDGVTTTKVTGDHIKSDISETNGATESAPDTDSDHTREQFQQVLRAYAPELGMSLKLDPSLFGNKEFMASYPAVSAFVAAHPEVPRSAHFYLEGVSIRGDFQPDPPNIRIWLDVFRDIGAFLVFLVVTGTLAWLIRTMIEQRRWSRLSRVQMETHGKLLERFASNEELLAYVQSPAGRRFLESAPIPLEAGPRALNAPVGRILWSVQVGVVVAAGGIGMLLVSPRLAGEPSQVLFGFGTLLVALGAGFVLSAAVSFFIARSMGLWTPPPPLSSEEGD